MTDTPTPAYMTLGEATKAVDASRSTLQRRLKAGDITGAYRDAGGVWCIPFSGLIAAGLAPRTTPADPEPEATEFEATEPDTVAEIERLRTALAASELLANERATTVELLRTVITELSAVLKASTPQLEAPTPPNPRGRRWFRR
jgi:hypothetical protein